MMFDMILYERSKEIDKGRHEIQTSSKAAGHRSEPGVELLHLLFDHKSTWDLAVPLPGDRRLKQQKY